MLFERLKGVIRIFVLWVTAFLWAFWSDFLVGARRAVSATSIVLLIVSAYIAGILLPTAIVSMSNATAYVGADANVIIIATVLLPIIVIVALALRFLEQGR